MGYPERGLVLDRFRGIVSDDVLREVQSIELPPGQRLDTFGWAQLCMDGEKRHRLLGARHGQTKAQGADDSGQFLQPHRRRPK
jgi:hypothetical protein